MPDDKEKHAARNTPLNPDKTVMGHSPATDPDATVLGDDATLADTPPPDTVTASGAPKHPDRIAHFRILGILGEGGMGAVYLAEQKEPVERQVALKVVHASLRSPEALLRFTAERQAMARLTHPNIAALYEAGATDDGFPYFAMENVPGTTLTRHCDEQNLSIDERLQLFVQVCNGVQHAHQKGIIHRDLKPSNLLVAVVEGKTVPKVIDFGIAKALDEPLHQAAELTGLQAIGTPAFMSPEALAGAPDLDTRTDVYSLGVVLYELLTGVRPHQKLGAAVTRFKATGERAPAKRPSTRMQELDAVKADAIAAGRCLSAKDLSKRIGGDLDWITMKAIADEPERRYATAADIAADINRHLRHEPVQARPPTFAYLAGRFVRRHRLAVFATALVAIALVLGVVGTSIGLIRAQKAETEALAQAERADLEAAAATEVANFMTGLFEVSDPGEARGNSITARELLDRGAQRIADDLGAQPLLQARLMRTMSDVYSKLGLYDAAEPLDKQALQLRIAELGPESPEVAEALNALGVQYRQQSRFAEAADLLLQALEIRERVFGPMHADVAESLNNLALVYWFLDRPDESEVLYRRALAIREVIFGPDAPEVAISLQHLGWFLKQKGAYEETASFLKRALTIRINALGGDHFLVAESLELLADLLVETGQYGEAEKLFDQALSIKTKVLDSEDPKIGNAYYSLGRLYRFQGRAEEAVIMLQRAVSHFEATLGPDHYEVANTLNDLGLVLADLGRWQDAEAAYRRQLGIYQTTLPEGHEMIGQSLNNLGWVLSDGLGQYAEGEEALRQAVALFSAGSGPDDYWNALSRWSLANNLRDQGRYPESEPWYTQSMEILQRTGGSSRVDNPDLAELVSDYAKMLRSAARETEAVALEERFSGK